MAPSIHKSRASSPALRESENTAKITLESEYTDTGKENHPVSKVEHVEKIIAKELPKEEPVAKPVQEQVALKKLRGGFKVLGAVAVVLFTVLAMLMMTIGSSSPITVMQTITSFASRMSTKAASSLTTSGSTKAACAIVILGAIGSVAYFAKKLSRAKKAA